MKANQPDATRSDVDSLSAEREVSTPVRVWGDGKPSLDGVIAQLNEHRRTHTEWAEFLEQAPGHESEKHVGEAAFHRDVESAYEDMIDYLRELRRPAEKTWEMLVRDLIDVCQKEASDYLRDARRNVCADDFAQYDMWQRRRQALEEMFSLGGAK